MNTFSRVTIFGAVFILAALGWLLWIFARSAYQTQVGVVRPQPVQFSHEHHVAGLGIDCRYCHTSVEDGPFAGIPATQICMQCHSQIWADSPKLEPVRASFRTGESIRWTRVHDLPDFVYFNHRIHVQRGVTCEACHGRVDQMPLAWRAKTLHMEWCLECHRKSVPTLPEFSDPNRGHLAAEASLHDGPSRGPESDRPQGDLPQEDRVRSDLPAGGASRTAAVTPELAHAAEALKAVSGADLPRDHPVLYLTNCSICHR